MYIDCTLSDSFLWLRFLPKKSTIFCHNSDPSTFLDHLGQHDTNMSISMCIISPNVAKASKFGIIEAQMMELFTKKLYQSK